MSTSVLVVKDVIGIRLVGLRTRDGAALVEGLKCLVPDDPTTLLALSSYCFKHYDDYYLKKKQARIEVSLEEVMLRRLRAMVYKNATVVIGDIYISVPLTT